MYSHSTYSYICSVFECFILFKLYVQYSIIVCTLHYIPWKCMRRRAYPQSTSTYYELVHLYFPGWCSAHNNNLMKICFLNNLPSCSCAAAGCACIAWCWRWKCIPLKLVLGNHMEVVSTYARTEGLRLNSATYAIIYI